MKVIKNLKSVGNNSLHLLLFMTESRALGLSHLGALTCGTRRHPITPSHTQFPSMHRHAHTQIYILICKAGGKTDLTVQPKTDFECITTTMKLLKHKLI